MVGTSAQLEVTLTPFLVSLGCSMLQNLFYDIYLLSLIAFRCFLFHLCNLFIPSSPGFLPKDMFAEHRRRSELTKSVQEAIKLLTMAGLELGSTQAATVLRAGEVSEEVIAGVQKIAVNNRIDEDRQAELQNKKERNEARSVSGENSDIDREVMEALENFDLEAYRNRCVLFFTLLCYLHKLSPLARFVNCQTKSPAILFNFCLILL